MPSALKRLSSIFKSSKSADATAEKAAKKEKRKSTSPTAEKTKVSRVVVVTGASRGLGLEFVKQLSKDPSTLIVAVARNPDKATLLKPLLSSRVIAVKADVTDQASITAAVPEIEKASGGKVDLLINNAAINSDPSVGIAGQTAASLDTQLHANVTGPIIFTNALLPLLRASTSPHKKLIFITTGMGSASYNNPTDWTFPLSFSAYAISKSALNLAVRKYALELAADKFVSVMISPGWVKTDMGGEYAPLTPEQSVSGVLKVINEASESDNGKFYSYDGTTIDF